MREDGRVAGVLEVITQGVRVVGLVGDDRRPRRHLDRQFVDDWRDELLGRAWDGLERIERQTGQLYHTVLSWRARHPELKSAQLAEQLSTRLGKEVSADWTRQTLHRARDKYAGLLVREVVQTLRTPSAELLAQELGELGLLEHCRACLARHAALH